MATYLNTALNMVPPVGYWRLDELAGLVAYDASGNANNGSYQSTLTYDITPGALVPSGDADPGMGFDALLGALNLPVNLGVSGFTGFTIVFWIKQTGGWHMAALTCDSNDNQLEYLDGAPYVSGSGDVIVFSADLSSFGGVGAGDLDEVGLWNVVLTPTQIATLYQAGITLFVNTGPKWYISARSNQTLLLVDAAIEADYEGLTLIKRWNDVGSWVLGLRAESAHAATFLPDASGNLHNGIIVLVDNQDGRGLQTVLTGPQLAVDGSLSEQSEHKIVVTGACDNYWLQKRISLPFAGWPYESDVILGHSFNPTRYYTLGDSSGSTAVDSSTSGQNGTYTGGFTLGKAAIIADPATSVLFDGSSGYVSVPTTGLPTANSNWSVFGWGLLTANPSSNAVMWWLGSNVAKEGVTLGVNSSGFPFFQVAGQGAVTGTTAVPLSATANQPIMLGMTWDGTTLTGYLNGASFGTWASGPLAITYGTVLFGANVGATNFWTNRLGHGVFFSANIGARQDVRNLYPWPTWAYRVGLSELAFVDYTFGNTQGAQADTDLWTFIWANLNFPSARMPAGFNAGASPNMGSTSGPTYSRFDNLLTLSQILALRSTPQLSFRIEQSGSNLNLTISEARNQSGTAIFSLARNNIRSYSWHYEAAKVNYIYAGGKQQVNGVPESRIFAENSDATSISRFGRLEAFLDARQAPDQPTLQSLITAELAKNAAIRSFAVTTQETDKLYFKGPGANGYDVGDLVTTVLEGQTFQDVIREIQIDLQPNQPAVVTPAIGTPNAAQVPNENNTAFNEIQNNGQATQAIAINY